jgi:hypothetical protein
VPNKFTAGPWFVSSQSERGRYINVTSAETARIVARVPWNTEREVNSGAHLTDAHDAALIAAAPELLAALRGLLDCCELNMDDMEPSTDEAITRAFTAIHKATGG